MLKKLQKRIFLAARAAYYWLALNGIRALAGIGLLKLYQPLPDVGLGMQFASDRIKRRWDAIMAHCPSEPGSVLDVGCNAGFYSFELAKLGHWVWGMEPQKPEYLVASTVRGYLGVENLQFMNSTLTPENIGRIPRFDVVLLMAVFHHWCRVYGTGEAMEMLRLLASRVEKVFFFETAQTDETSEKHRRVLPDMGDDPESWIRERLMEFGFSRVETVVKGGRHLFAAYR